jgi:hypothetical protein
MGMILVWYGVCLSMSPDQRFLLPMPHDILRAFSCR